MKFGIMSVCKSIKTNRSFAFKDLIVHKNMETKFYHRLLDLGLETV